MDYMVENDNDTDPDGRAGFAFGYQDLDDFTNRERGMFTTADREHLIGLKDYSQPQGRSNAKQRIRERVRETIRDFGLLWAIDNDNRDKVFSDIDEQNLYNDLATLIEFVYLGLGKDESIIEQIVRDGIRTAEDPDLHQVDDDLWSREGSDGDQINVKQIEISVNIDVDIEYGPDVDGVERLYREEGPGGLTQKQIGQLVEHGRLDKRDLEAIEKSKD